MFRPRRKSALPTPTRLLTTLQSALPEVVEIVDRETIDLGTAPKEIVTCRIDGGCRVWVGTAESWLGREKAQNAD